MRRSVLWALVLIVMSMSTGVVFGRDVIFEDDFETGDYGGSWSSGGMAVTLPGGVRLDLMLIPAGTFMMGSPPGEPGQISTWEDLHEVTLTTSYYVGKFEVTQGQWEAVMGTTPWSDATCMTLGEGAAYPAYCVSWEMIAGPGGFVETLNAYLSSTSQPAGMRLPTEAEWERAARAETQSEFSFDTSTNPEWDLYCGDFPEAEDYMWWCGSGDIPRRGPREVGTKLANGYFLHDMHGNVFEWVADWWQTSMGHAAQVDPTGPATGAARVFRGGSWVFPALGARSAYRNSAPPPVDNSQIGFRLARTR